MTAYINILMNMNFVYISLQRVKYIPYKLIMPGKWIYNSFALYHFCLELFRSIFFTSYIWSLSDKDEKLEPQAKDWGQKATKGEAINSGVSVTVEEGHSKQLTITVSSLLSSIVLLHKQYSRFTISEASCQEETFHFDICGNQTQGLTHAKQACSPRFIPRTEHFNIGQLVARLAHVSLLLNDQPWLDA